MSGDDKLRERAELILAPYFAVSGVKMNWERHVKKMTQLLTQVEAQARLEEGEWWFVNSDSDLFGDEQMKRLAELRRQAGAEGEKR